MKKKFKTRPILLLTLLVALLCCGTAFAYDTGEPPGPGKSFMIASDNTKGPSDIQKTPSIVLADTNYYGLYQNKDTGTASQAAFKQQIDTMAAIEPPGAMALTDHKKLSNSGKHDGSPGLVASGSYINTKCMYCDSAGFYSKFTAAAPTMKSSPYGLARAPDTPGAMASMKSTAYGFAYTTGHLGAGPMGRRAHKGPSAHTKIKNKTDK